MGVDRLSLAYYTAISILALVLSGTLLLLVIAPTQYDPYNPEMIEAVEEEENEKTRRTLEPGELYAKYRIPENVSINMQKSTSVQVVVLGDIGRSPRMQYHALSLAKHGARVDVIGFKESQIHPDLAGQAKVNIVPLRPPPAFLQTRSKMLFLLVGPLKVIWQTVNLYHALCYQTEPAMWMLVQNPPSIPVLAVAKIACIFRGTRLIIDWHNFGWSILALKLGQDHPLVKISKVYESAMSKTADAHITVTNAMAKVIKKMLNEDALALHDRPAKSFQPLDARERSTVLRRLEQTAPHVEEIEKGSWRLVVSSTSWTADEDFSILLDALVAYCDKAASDESLPYILAIITGKGPQKEHYTKKVQELSQSGKLPRATVSTAWLSTEDYAALLGAADLGVSLHTSSSGVDLPMKVVDMFGAGLPVVGWSEFEAWPELVKEGINGRGFGSAEELQELFVELFSGSGDKLKTIKQGALREGDRRWDDEWDAVAGKQVFHIVD